MLDLILLEDEPVLRDELGEFLEEQGFAADCVASVQEFDQRFDATRHRIAIIDIGLPDGDGLQLIQRLRDEGQRVGILVFSARNTSHDKINGLDVGADHYLGKGCSLDVLGATLSSMLRRLGLRRAQGGWRLALQAGRLQAVDELPVLLPREDVLLLQVLMQHAGEIVTPAQIVQAMAAECQGYDAEAMERHLSVLRRKVQDGCRLLLPVKTVRGQGYSFQAQAEVVA